MTAFNTELDNWLTDGRAQKYFRERDSDAILPLERVLAVLASPEMRDSLPSDDS